jgi:hypothetical protein
MWKWMCLLETLILLAWLLNLDEESPGLLKDGMCGRKKARNA